MTTAIPREKWAAEAQPGEREWWRANMPAPEGIEACAAAEFAADFGQREFDGKTIMDIGCGPTVLTGWFTGAEIVAVDPLADSYRGLLGNRLGLAAKVYAQPAEILIPELVEKADAVFSVNALDHAFDLGACLWNIAAYLKPSGLAFIDVDLHPGWGDSKHPLRMSRREVESAFNRNGLCIEWHKKSAPHGDGDGHVWLLRKAD
jgi:SAM-dependent methyltransferase